MNQLGLTIATLSPGRFMCSGTAVWRSMTFCWRSWSLRAGLAATTDPTSGSYLRIPYQVDLNSLRSELHWSYRLLSLFLRSRCTLTSLRVFQRDQLDPKARRSAHLIMERAGWGSLIPRRVSARRLLCVARMLFWSAVRPMWCQRGELSLLQDKLELAKAYGLGAYDRTCHRCKRLRIWREKSGRWYLLAGLSKVIASYQPIDWQRFLVLTTPRSPPSPVVTTLLQMSLHSTLSSQWGQLAAAQAWFSLHSAPWLDSRGAAHRSLGCSKRGL